MIIYTVKPNDTLSSIGANYGLSPQFIQNINLLPNPLRLVVGQSIIILFPEVSHTVKAGETIYSISRSYDTDIITILQNNPFLYSRTYLYEGETIVISYETDREKTVISNAYTYGNLKTDEENLSYPYLTYVTPFTYGFETTGSLVYANDINAIKNVAYFGVCPLMHLSTFSSKGNFSSQLASTILNSPDVQNVLAENILQNIIQKGYCGVDVDFEYLPAEDAEKYAKFIGLLTEKLNAQGYITVTALAPKVSAEQKGAVYEGHIYPLIAENSNYCFVMTYEWGYTYGPPMAVAPINNVRRVLDYAVSVIPPEKIWMGVPTYGYDWTLPFVRGGEPALSISNSRAVETALKYKADIKFDEQAQSPYFFYTDEDSRVHEVWFEDARSIYSKLQLISEYGLSGCGYWNLERPFPQNWMILNNMYFIKKI